MGLQVLKSVGHSSADSKGRLAVSPDVALSDQGRTPVLDSKHIPLGFAPKLRLKLILVTSFRECFKWSLSCHPTPHFPYQFTYSDLQIFWCYSCSSQVESVNMPSYLHLVWFSSVALQWFMSWDRWMQHFARSAAPSIFWMFSSRFWFCFSW